MKVPVDLEDIQSLTEFQRTTRKAIARLKKTGRAAILTVNGHAEIVVQDAKAYQRLLARAEEADRLLELRRSIADHRAGRTRSLDDALGEIEARHLRPAKRTSTRRPAKRQ